jgi:hypothetical protein
MRSALPVLVALAFLALAAGDAFAFSCPTLVKAANESIAKAEPLAAKASGDREKARATAMVDEAKDLVKQAEADHASGNHARAEAKAKAAKALAEMVK